MSPDSLTAPEPVTLEDIEAAAGRLAGVIRELPVAGARWLDDRVGGRVHLITENLQRAGSFKIRGAYNRISLLTDEERGRGVVAASAGNHAQGVALAAQLLGVRATVFMPEGATIPKVQATLAYGADVRFAGSTIDEALMAAMAYGDETGAVLIHPFDHRDIVAGQGTLGLEILQKVPDVRTIVVCTGGGGLLAGIAMAVKSQRPDVRIVGVQARDAAAYPGSLAAGHPVALEHMSTMADGIAVGRPGAVPFAIVRDLVDDIETVTEDEISRAVLLLLERAKLLVEPAGAAATAAVLANPKSFEPPVAVVVSGGNVDSLLLMRIIRHGLAAAGRYLTVTVRVPDRPGSLARLLAEVKDLQANVLEVQHDRLDAGLGVDEVDIVVQVETRGHEHCEEVLDALAGRYRIVSQSIDR
ncbi:MAG: threonine ammonia-lyase [Actinobacteria bacterium]|uniref:threonine ammonia-lyase n=1 Tax=freshwater metagenome TaxID=449393 RepID=A0A6J7P9W0_9ZZZZ|nr:threonine ammonia-lyase [Actinomycetota bacterium]